MFKELMKEDVTIKELVEIFSTIGADLDFKLNLGARRGGETTYRILRTIIQLKNGKLKVASLLNHHDIRTRLSCGINATVFYSNYELEYHFSRMVDAIKMLDCLEIVDGKRMGKFKINYKRKTFEYVKYKKFMKLVSYIDCESEEVFVAENSEIFNDSIESILNNEVDV